MDLPNGVFWVFDAPPGCEDGRVTLHGYFAPGGEPTVYNLASLIDTLERVKSHRDSYSTETAWLEAIETIEAGLKLFLSHKAA